MSLSILIGKDLIMDKKRASRGVFGDIVDKGSMGFRVPFFAMAGLCYGARVIHAVAVFLEAVKWGRGI